MFLLERGGRMLSVHLKTKGQDSAGYQPLASASQMLVGMLIPGKLSR